MISKNTNKSNERRISKHVVGYVVTKKQDAVLNFSYMYMYVNEGHKFVSRLAI